MSSACIRVRRLHAFMASRSACCFQMAMVIPYGLKPHCRRWPPEWRAARLRVVHPRAQRRTLDPRKLRQRGMAMKRIGWLLVLLVPIAVVLPQRAWALRCGTHIVKQGDLAPQLRDECGDPFYIGYYVGP